jgi:hypothetical protein
MREEYGLRVCGNIVLRKMFLNRRPHLLIHIHNLLHNSGRKATKEAAMRRFDRTCKRKGMGPKKKSWQCNHNLRSRRGLEGDRRARQQRSMVADCSTELQKARDTSKWFLIINIDITLTSTGRKLPAESGISVTGVYLAPVVQLELITHFCHMAYPFPTN